MTSAGKARSGTKMDGLPVYQAQFYSNGVMGCSIAFSNSSQEFTNPLEGSHDVTSFPFEGTSPSLVFAKRISGAALSAAFSLAGSASTLLTFQLFVFQVSLTPLSSTLSFPIH